jgi:propionate catabolism operon transcriptional regulator
MKIKTLVIAPYQGLVEISSSLKSELYDFDVTVVQGDLSEVLPQVQGYEDNGFDIIISRGGTARLIREHTTLPVVEIQVSGYDIMRMLTLVEGYKVPIEMIGFPNIIENAAAVSKLMKVNVPFQIVHKEDEVEPTIQLAKQRGVMVVIGDTITVRKAKEAGLQGVLITSGRESVLEAFYRARQIYQSTLYYKSYYLMYKKMADQLDQGIAIIADDGKLKEANTAFYRMLQSSESTSHENHSLLNQPSYKQLIHTLCKEEVFPETPVSIGKKQIFIVSGEAFQLSDERLYCVLLRSASEDEVDFKLTFSKDFINSFPQLITSNKDFLQLLSQVGEFNNPLEPIALYGESGVGKRLLVGALNNDQQYFMEIEMMNRSDRAAERLLSILAKIDEQTVVYLKGTENLDTQTQRSIVKLIPQMNARLFFFFEIDPKRLVEIGRLQPKLYQLFENNVLYIPPMREKPENLEEYIRTFIVKYNEMFGKQIVGIRHEVLEQLLAYPWNNNLVEVMETIKAFVKNTTGEFIEA